MASGRFPCKQGLLALHTPRIARERAVVPHHAVTRNSDRQVVCGAGAGDGTDRFGRTDLLRDLRVGDGLTNRDVLERLPHTPLEGGAAHIERQIEAEGRSFDEADDTRYKRFVVPVGSDQAGSGETILELAHQFFRVVAKKDRGNTFLARRDEDGAKGYFTDGKTNLLVRAARAILGRRHAQHVRGLLVEATAGIETGIVDGFRDTVTARQAFANLRRAMGSRVVLGREAGDRLEAAVETSRAAATRFR